MNETGDLASYLLGERSELKALLEAIAGAEEDRDRERAAVEYLLVLAAARQAAKGQAVESKALAQIGRRYNRALSGWESEHGRLLQGLYESLRSGAALDVVTTLKLLGLHHRKMGRYQLARPAFSVAVELTERSGEPLEQLNLLFWLGVVERYLGNLDAAERVHGEQLRKARALDSRGQAVLAQENLGLVSLRRGDVSDARKKVIRALTEARELEDRELEGYCYHALMVVEIQAGRPGEAAACGWEAYQRYESLDQRLRALQDCGVIFYDCGVFEPARAAFEIVAALHLDSASRIRAKTGLADVAAAVGERERFVELAAELEEDEPSVEMPFERLSAYRSIGLGYVKFGEAERGKAYLKKSLALARKIGYTADAGELERIIGTVSPDADIFVIQEPPPEERDRLRIVGENVIAERARAIA